MPQQQANERPNMTQTHHSFDPDASQQAAFRRALGCFGTGVTIITTATDNGPLGFTANSFSSVSLRPPLVQWSVARDASRHDAFVAAKNFNVHVLGLGQSALAHHFAKNGDGFGKFDWQRGPDGVPVLQGCLARFSCSTYGIHPAGDHSLILGQVRHVVAQDDPGAALLFVQGRFGTFTDTCA